MKKSTAAGTQALFQAVLAIAVPLVIGIAIYLVIMRTFDNSAVETLKGSLETTRTETRGNTEAIAKQGRSIEDHETRITAAEGEIRVHAGKIDAAEKAIRDHEDRIGKNSRDIEDAKREAGELRTRIDSLEKDLAGVREEGAKDRTRVEALEKRLAELREEMKALTEGLAKRMDMLEKMALEKKASQ